MRASPAVRTWYGGIMHMFIFWGFVTLLIGTIIVMIEDDITVPIFKFSFYTGDFYLGYKLAMNLAGAHADRRRDDGVLPSSGRSARSSRTRAPTIWYSSRSCWCWRCRDSHLQALRLAVVRDPWGPWSFISYPLSLSLRGLADRLAGGGTPGELVRPFC